MEKWADDERRDGGRRGAAVLGGALRALAVLRPGGAGRDRAGDAGAVFRAFAEGMERRLAAGRSGGPKVRLAGGRDER